MSDALDTLIRSARRRSTLVASLSAASRGLAVGAAALLTIALWHRFVAPAPALLAGLVLVLPVAVALAASWFSLPAPLALAGAIDRRFATCSLLASAWATRAQAPTPATRIVHRDATARAVELHAQLPLLWPLRLPASTAGSVAGVLAATFLLVQPGAAMRRVDVPSQGVAGAANTTHSEASRSREARARGTPRSSVRTESAAADTAARREDEPHAGAGETRAPAAPSAPDTGDAPGRSEGAAAPTTDATGATLATRWRERARLAGAGTTAGTSAAGGGDTMARAHTDDAPSPIAAAHAQTASYEPALDPALAAYVRAVARESKR